MIYQPHLSPIAGHNCGESEGGTLMKKYVRTPKGMTRREFENRAKQILPEIQKSLLPDHASEIVAINVETGEYTLGGTTVEARTAFRKRWPGQLAYLIRANGGPVVKFHGM